MAGRRIDVEALIDGQKFGAFPIRVLVLALLALIIEGYDIQVMSFAAPSLLKAWHLKRAAFAPVLSAGLFGILFGAPAFGWIGDRIGRKTCILISSVAYGLFSLCLLLAQDLNTLVIMRFIAGLGMGGVVPNAIAIAAELAPRKMRAGMAGSIGVGITIGGILPGLVVAQLPAGPVFRELYLIGGIAPLALAALIALGLPESIAFLVQRGGSRVRIASLANQIDPALKADADDEFVLPQRPAGEKAGIGALFAGPLKLVTPLLWIMFAASLLSLFMLTSWMPLLLEASGFTARDAAATNSLFQIGGAISGVVVALLLGRLGPRLPLAMFVLSLITIAIAARAPLSNQALAAMIAVCGFCITGIQCSLNGTAGLAYPTPVRSQGLGACLGIGRIGAVVGPLIAGAMVASGVTSARDLFLLPLLPLAVATAASLVVMLRLNLKDSAGATA
jgi:AAHS family 4-hydroxybenzoate transporter-like MFS transporter